MSGLLDAFALAADQDPSLHLVLAGPPGWGDVGRELPAGAPWASRVHHLGRLPYDDLRVAYAAATAFCFPSIWEGFGLPVLEAMSVGTPVVTSIGTSMAEVVGDAGVLVTPTDPAQLAAGLLRATGPERDPLARAAFEGSRVFTWEHAAEQTMDSYRAAINVPPR